MRKKGWKEKIVTEFLTGLSMVGLARKNGVTTKFIEQIIREYGELRGRGRT